MVYGPRRCPGFNWDSGFVTPIPHQSLQKVRAALPQATAHEREHILINVVDRAIAVHTLNKAGLGTVMRHDARFDFRMIRQPFLDDLGAVVGTSFLTP